MEPWLDLKGCQQSCNFSAPKAKTLNPDEVSWGDLFSGGDSSAAQDQLRDVRKIVARPAAQRFRSYFKGRSMYMCAYVRISIFIYIYIYIYIYRAMCYHCCYIDLLVLHSCICPFVCLSVCLSVGLSRAFFIDEQLGVCRRT